LRKPSRFRLARPPAIGAHGEPHPATRVKVLWLARIPCCCRRVSVWMEPEFIIAR
jgi:hypothetical protein